MQLCARLDNYFGRNASVAASASAAAAPSAAAVDDADVVITWKDDANRSRSATSWSAESPEKSESSGKTLRGPGGINGAAATGALSLLLHVLKARTIATAGHSDTAQSQQGIPIPRGRHMRSAAVKSSGLPHPRYPLSNTHTSQPETPRKPRTSDLITLGSGGPNVAFWPPYLSAPLPQVPSCLPREATTTIELLCKAQAQVSLGPAASQELYKGHRPTKLEPSVLTIKSGNYEQLTDYCRSSQLSVTPLATHPCVDSLPPNRIPNENGEVTEMDGVPLIPDLMPWRLNTKQPDLQAFFEDTLPSETAPRPPPIANLHRSPDDQATESDVLYSQSGCLIPDIDPTRGLYVSGCIFDINGSSVVNSNSDLAPVLYQTSGSCAHAADQVEKDPALDSLLFHGAVKPDSTDPEEIMRSISDLCLTRTMSGGDHRIPIESSTASTMNLPTTNVRDSDLLCPYQAVQGAPGAVDALPKAPDAAPSPFALPAPDVIPMIQPKQPAANTPLSPRPDLLDEDR
eukprot:gene31578-6775_t